MSIEKCRYLWGVILLFIPYLWISKIHFWISIIQFLISKNRLMDILKYIFGYPKTHPDFWISINQILDIQKSVEY